jgi:hypothetical protein
MGSDLALTPAMRGFALVNGQIQYGSVRLLTPAATPIRRRWTRRTEPSRFLSQRSTSRSVMLIFGGSLLLGGLLIAVPREIPGIAVTILLGGAWLSLVLAMTLPSRSERAGAELARRLGQFRHKMNTIGDHPTRADLESLLGLARDLELRDEEISDELAQIRASLEAVDLAGKLAHDALPVVTSVEPLAPGDVCHFVTPVRFGRRRSDQFGHLSFTSGWLKFRGALDISVAWTEVTNVQRAGRDIIVSLHDSKRVLRFSCNTISEAAQAGVLAQHLIAISGPRATESTGESYHASL